MSNSLQLLYHFLRKYKPQLCKNLGTVISQERWQLRLRSLASTFLPSPDFFLIFSAGHFPWIPFSFLKWEIFVRKHSRQFSRESEKMTENLLVMEHHLSDICAGCLIKEFKIFFERIINSCAVNESKMILYEKIINSRANLVNSWGFSRLQRNRQ